MVLSGSGLIHYEIVDDALDIGLEEIEVSVMVRQNDWGLSNEQATLLLEERISMAGLISAMLVNWQFPLPAIDGLDVAELTRVEMAHRRHIWKSVSALRQQPGHEDVYLMETAPQLGVRITRLLAGAAQLTYKGVQARATFPDVIGVGGMWNATHPEWQIPYGALIPKRVDGVIAAGRCISGEARMSDLLRVIPPCFVTGHAAGVAAAVAVKDRCRPRDVAVPTVQKILREQDAYLG